MKKLVLFLGGVVVGYVGCCGLIGLGKVAYDETLHETDKYVIKKATNTNKDCDIAVIEYK